MLAHRSWNVRAVVDEYRSFRPTRDACPAVSPAAEIVSFLLEHDGSGAVCECIPLMRNNF
jgi:hypothetical protein